MAIIYAEFVNGQVPVLITGNMPYGLSIEVRAYDHMMKERISSTWQRLTFEQAKILHDNLKEWIDEIEARRANK